MTSRPAVGPTDPRSERIGIAAAAIAAISFGAAYPAAAVMVRSFAPLAGTAIYATGALVVVVLLAWIGILPRPTRAVLRRGSLGRLLILSLTGGLAFIAGMSIGVQLAGATITGFVANLYTVVAVLLAVPLLGERLTPSVLGAFVLAVLGTALLADPASLHGSIDGVLAGLVAAFGFGAYLVLARRWGRTPGLDITTITLAVLVGRGPMLLAIELVRAPDTLIPATIDLGPVLAMVYLALVPSTLAQVMVVVSTRHVAARRTSAWLLLSPLTSAVVAILLLGEAPTLMEWLGGALVFLGILGASGVGRTFRGPWRTRRASA